MFAHLIVVAAFIWYQRLKMPESTEWTEAKAKEKELIAEGTFQKVTYAMILKGTSLKTVLLCCGVYTLWNISASTAGFFMPYIYEHVGNLSNTMALVMQCANFAVCILATVVFMYFGDKVNRRILYTIFGAAAMIAWTVWTLPAEMLQTWMLWAFTIVNGFAMQQQFYQLWSSELFPVRYRATAQGFTFFVTRFAAAIWAFVVPILMESVGFRVAAGILVALSAVSWLVGAIWAPDDRGKTLEQITTERYGHELDGEDCLVNCEGKHS